VRIPENNQSILFGGTFLLANKLQWVADRTVPGISSKQWFLLLTLSEMPAEPTPNMASLAHELDTSRQNVAKMLEALERQGHVALADNPADRRSRTVALTAQGRQTLGLMSGQSRDFFRRLFCGIGEEECAAAARVTVKMIENLLKMQADIIGG
jgi:DNA-binding MarR family transcriptional regulator